MNKSKNPTLSENIFRSKNLFFFYSNHFVRVYRWEIVNISFFWPNRAELRQITCRLNSLFSDGSQCQIFLPFSSTIAEHKSRICLFFRATTLHKNTNKLNFFIIYHRNKIVWPNKEKNFIFQFGLEFIVWERHFFLMNQMEMCRSFITKSIGMFVGHAHSIQDI